MSPDSGPELVWQSQSQMPNSSIDRRKFVSVAAAALPVVAARAAPKPRRVALVGSGWYGKNNLFRLVEVEDVEIVAVCDPDSKSVAASAKTSSKRHRSGKQPRTYGDYRELLK